MREPIIEYVGRRPLRQDLQPRLTTMIEALGLRAAARDIGVHPQTILALAAGMRANHSTVFLVEQKLAGRDADGEDV